MKGQRWKSVIVRVICIMLVCDAPGSSGPGSWHSTPMQHNHPTYSQTASSLITTFKKPIMSMCRACDVHGFGLETRVSVHIRNDRQNHIQSPCRKTPAPCTVSYPQHAQVRKTATLVQHPLSLHAQQAYMLTSAHALCSRWVSHPLSTAQPIHMDIRFTFQTPTQCTSTQVHPASHKMPLQMSRARACPSYPGTW